MFGGCVAIQLSTYHDTSNKIPRNAGRCLTLEIFPSFPQHPESGHREATAPHWRPRPWDGAALTLRPTPGRAHGDWWLLSKVTFFEVENHGKLRYFSPQKKKSNNITIVKSRKIEIKEHRLIPINPHEWERNSSKST